jgi:hypothetical protein
MVWNTAAPEIFSRGTLEKPEHVLYHTTYSEESLYKTYYTSGLLHVTSV